MSNWINFLHISGLFLISKVHVAYCFKTKGKNLLQIFMLLGYEVYAFMVKQLRNTRQENLFEKNKILRLWLTEKVKKLFFSESLNFSFDSGQVRCITSSHIVRFSSSFGRGIGGRYNTTVGRKSFTCDWLWVSDEPADSESWPERMVSLCRFQKLTIYVHMYLNSRYM